MAELNTAGAIEKLKAALQSAALDGQAADKLQDMPDVADDPALDASARRDAIEKLQAMRRNVKDDLARAKAKYAAASTAVYKAQEALIATEVAPPLPFALVKYGDALGRIDGPMARAKAWQALELFDSSARNLRDASNLVHSNSTKFTMSLLMIDKDSSSLAISKHLSMLFLIDFELSRLTHRRASLAAEQAERDLNASLQPLRAPAQLS